MEGEEQNCALYSNNKSDPFHIGNTYGGLPTNLVRIWKVTPSEYKLFYPKIFTLKRKLIFHLTLSLLWPYVYNVDPYLSYEIILLH